MIAIRLNGKKFESLPFFFLFKGATVIPIAIMLCLLPCCPESPRFLMLVTMDEDEAEKGQRAKYTF